jgi:lipoic acid synthetase
MTDSLLTKKPDWLKKKIDLNKCRDLHNLFSGLKLNTVCKQAQCPNISECFSAKVATFLILGNVCTRGCRFCAVKKGAPEKVDKDEPQRLVQAVEQLGLKHVVITSVTRDDLADKGAGAFADCIKALKLKDSSITVEVLLPDFKADKQLIRQVLDAGCDIFAHNIETVPELYSAVRQGADYEQSLRVLTFAKSIDKNIYTKSGIMLGLGETKQQVLDVLNDIRDTGCDFLSIGQYLSPSKNHYPVKKFIHPDEFAWFKNKALGIGFRHVESGPYIRSSYIASAYL